MTGSMRIPRGHPLHADIPTSSVEPEAYLAHLQQEDFTGAVRLRNEKQGFVLLVRGQVRAAECDGRGGMEALEALLDAMSGEGSVDVLEYGPDQADAVLTWYEEIHEHPSVSWTPEAQPRDVVLGREAVEENAKREISREIGEDFLDEVRSALKPE